MSEDEGQSTIEAGSNAYTVALPSGGFEGPLDLLLHLCQKHELDILDIPISFVTARYLEYIAVMQVLNLDLAADYLVMAATLAHIKSKMLLPAPPPGQEDDVNEEELDPRAALIARLLEYQKYKRAGEDLTARGVTGRDAFTRGATLAEAVQTGVAPLADIPLYRLVEAFQSVVQRSKVKLTHDIVADRISITDRIHQLTDILRDTKRTTFEALFEGQYTAFDLIITFLALLEMSRLKMTRLTQPDPLGTLWVELADAFGSDFENAEFEDAGPPLDGNGNTEAPEGMNTLTEAPQAMDEPQPFDSEVPTADDHRIVSTLTEAPPGFDSPTDAPDALDAPEGATEAPSLGEHEETAEISLTEASILEMALEATAELPRSEDEDRDMLAAVPTTDDPAPDAGEDA